MHFPDTGNAPVEQLVAEFHRALKDSVDALQLFDDVGAFLSGGTDSSCVTAAVTRERQGPDILDRVRRRRLRRVEYARITVDRLNRAPSLLRDTAGRGGYTALMAAYYDEPFGNASAVPAYFCGLARRRRASGTCCGGGDEIFGSNTRYVKQKVFSDYWTRLPAPLRTALIEPLVMHFPLGERIAPLRKRSYIAQATYRCPTASRPITSCTANR